MFVRRAILFDLQRADNSDREGLSRQRKRLGFREQIHLAGRGIVLQEVDRAALCRIADILSDDLPLLIENNRADDSASRVDSLDTRRGQIHIDLAQIPTGGQWSLSQDGTR